MNLMSLIEKFPNDDECREALEEIRWPAGVCCTRCGDLNVLELPKHNRWKCRSCGYQFSVMSGTIMHDSHLPLRKWFIAIYLMCESKKGISACQMQRTLGVAYRTAWYLCHRIREAMGNEPFEGPTLLGVVEVDETLIGGKKKGKGRAYKGNKTWVAGAIQRGGKVRIERIPNVKKWHAPRFHQSHRERTRPRPSIRMNCVLHRHRGQRHAPRNSKPLRGSLGRGRRSHKQRGRRVEPVQAFAYRAHSTR